MEQLGEGRTHFTRNIAITNHHSKVVVRVAKKNKSCEDNEIKIKI